MNPFAYIVYFKSTALGEEEITPLAESSKILMKMGISKETIQNWDLSRHPSAVFGLDGHLLYMNEMYRKYTGRGDDDLMKTYLYEILLANQHVKDAFAACFASKPERLDFETEWNLHLTKTVAQCVCHLVRSDIFTHFLESIGNTKWVDICLFL
jgi:hypothetical protein